MLSASLLLSFAIAAADAPDLVIADKGKPLAVIVVAADAGQWEKRAAADLAEHIELLCGAKPTVAATAPPTTPAIVVGSAALWADPSLKQALAKVAKPNPTLRADAIVLRRAGNRVLVAGSNDDSHYYAAAELLHRWGCRWYMPTDIGECVPETPTLTVDKLAYAYAPPFEVRNYWIAWNGSNAGAPEFLRRNRFAPGVGV